MNRFVLALSFFVCLSAATQSQEPTQPGKEHQFLAETVGEWSVTIASPGGDMSGKCVYKMAHNGLWLTSQLDMKMPVGTFTGQGLDSYDPVKKKFIAIWVDSMSASPLVLEGDRSADGKKVTLTGKGPGPDGNSVSYKTETEYVSKDKHVFKMWMGSDSGEPMMVATYSRTK